MPLVTKFLFHKFCRAVTISLTRTVLSKYIQLSVQCNLFCCHIIDLNTACTKTVSMHDTNYKYILKLTWNLGHFWQYFIITVLDYTEYLKYKTTEQFNNEPTLLCFKSTILYCICFSFRHWAFARTVKASRTFYNSVEWVRLNCFASAQHLFDKSLVTLFFQKTRLPISLCVLTFLSLDKKKGCIPFTERANKIKI